MTTPGVFRPNKYPLPNMIVQEGGSVIIKDLKSEEGKALNGKDGKALKWNMGNCRWLIELEDGTVKQIRIENLAVVGDMRVGFSFAAEGQGPELVGSGTLDGVPAIMIFDDPKRAGFNLELVKAKFLLMGVPPNVLDKATAPGGLMNPNV